MNCWKCQKSLDESDYGRQNRCPCGWDTRVCKNCSFYDRSSYNECRETQADRVVEKEKSNFCDYFKPGSPQGQASKADLKAAADALFKK